MPLADWLGETRHGGFARQLAIIADALNLQGDIDHGTGYFTVAHRGVSYCVTVHLENASVLIRAFSNVRFPPDDLPREVAAALTSWKARKSAFHWDALAGERFSCFFIQCALRLNQFDVALVAEVIEGLTAEAASFDRTLRGGPPRQIHQQQAQSPTLLPAPAAPILQAVGKAVSFLLKGPPTNGRR